MHKSHEILKDGLSEAAEKIAVGSLYYHYKNPALLYRVLRLAVTEADDSVCVVYEAQYGDKLVFVRPLSSWLDEVTLNGKTVSRFTVVAADE